MYKTSFIMNENKDRIEDEDFMDFGKTDVIGCGIKLKPYEKLFNDGEITEEVFNRIAKDLQKGIRKE